MVARDGDGVGEMCEGGWNIKIKKVQCITEQRQCEETEQGIDQIVN